MVSRITSTTNGYGKGDYQLKLLVIKLFCIGICVPLFPFVLFARWHEVSNNGVKVDWKRETNDYWNDMYRVLKQKRINKK